MSNKCKDESNHSIDCACFVCDDDKTYVLSTYIGSDSLIIDSIDPEIFNSIRVRADYELGTWIIERLTNEVDEEGNKHSRWIKWVRIPGKLSTEY